MTHIDTTDTQICDIIGQAIGLGPNSVLPATNLRGDLGLDSVGLLSLAYIIEEQTGIDAFAHAQDFIEAQSASDIIDLVRRYPRQP
jgi:acyl carrier protein